MRFTDKQLAERAKLIFNSEYVSEEVNAHNQAEWIKNVKQLGDKWLLSEQTERKTS